MSLITDVYSYFDFLSVQGLFLKRGVGKVERVKSFGKVEAALSDGWGA
jgi:hypothetical protein